jgi:hypothetical protein
MAPVRSITHAVTDRRRTLPRPGRAGPLSRVALFVGLAVIAVLGIALVNGALRAPGPAHPSPGHPSAAHPSPAQPPAAEGPLVVGDGRAVTLVNLGGSATDAVLARVSADIGPAVAKVEGFWGTDWSRDITIMATATDVEFSAATAGMRAPSADTANLAAVTVADSVDPSRREVSGQRIVLSPGASRMSAESLRIVLAHELFHYASRADTASDAPRWLTEGVADFVARPAPQPTADEPTLPTALPSDADFAASGQQLSRAYDRAWSFARYVADRYGPTGLRTPYQRACCVNHPDFAAALPQAIGISEDEALAGWRDWLAGHR